VGVLLKLQVKVESTVGEMVENEEAQSGFTF